MTAGVDRRERFVVMKVVRSGYVRVVRRICPSGPGREGKTVFRALSGDNYL